VPPDALRKLVEELAWAANVPADLAAVPLLAMGGGALANARHPAVTPSHVQSPCLYAATVRRPGSGKSVPLRVPNEPFNDIQLRWLREWEEEMRAWGAGAGRCRSPAAAPWATSPPRRSRWCCGTTPAAPAA
jgi:hypothetical protein